MRRPNQQFDTYSLIDLLPHGLMTSITCIDLEENK